MGCWPVQRLILSPKRASRGCAKPEFTPPIFHAPKYAPKIDQNGVASPKAPFSPILVMGHTIKMALKSLTLVKVGPVTTKSDKALKKPCESCRSA